MSCLLRTRAKALVGRTVLAPIGESDWVYHAIDPSMRGPVEVLRDRDSVVSPPVFPGLNIAAPSTSGSRTHVTVSSSHDMFTIVVAPVDLSQVAGEAAVATQQKYLGFHRDLVLRRDKTIKFDGEFLLGSVSGNLGGPSTRWTSCIRVKHVVFGTFVW